MNVFEKLPWLPWVLIGVMLLALVLVLHAFLGLPLLLGILFLLVVALVAAIVVLVRQLKQSQAAEAIEQTITTQADADIEKSTPGQLAEMQRLKEDLLAAIDTLKRSGRKGGDDALARLPWYMVIGPAQAGKSELIRRSGLHFPLTDGGDNPRAVRGVGGTRGFSWWLAEEGVLLDMSGRTLATAAFDDSGDWLAFLQTLRRQRPGKPINGVVVVVSVDQVADQPESRIDSLARATRERLEELVQNLGVVYPVYVVFNRCDRVAGFQEFFEDLSTDERRAPWGATLSVERARAHAADALFDEELDVLLATLSERRLPRMAAMPEAISRARAFAFPLQVSRVRPALRRYLRTLFEAEAGADAPLFRGFYFTAAAQQGEATDRVMQPAVRTLGLTVRAPEGTGPARPGAWFVRDLFTDLVFADASLATASQGARGRLQQRDRVLLGGFGIGVLLFALMFSGFSCANGALVGRTRRAAVEVASLPEDTPIVRSLAALDRLRSGVAVIDSLVQKKPLWRKLGGYAGDRLDPPALQLWAGRTVQVLVAPALRQMEDELRQLTDSGQGDFLHYYKLFRAWRLLSEPDQITTYDAELLAGEVERVQSTHMTIGSATDEERRQFPGLVSRQMAFLASHPGALKQVAGQYYRPADPVLTQRAAQRLRDTWDSRQFYADMVQRAAAHLPPATFASLVGPSATMADRVEVPGPFTLAGWQRQVQPRIEDYRALMRRDRVLLDIYEQRPPDLAGDLLSLYAADYSAHWVAFLNGVQVNPVRDMGEATQMLKVLGQDDSPLFKLMKKVRDQTQLGVAADSPLAKVGLDFAVLRDFFATPGGGADKAAGFLRRFLPKGGTPDATDRSQTPSVLYQASLKAATKQVAEGAQPGQPPTAIAQLINSGGDKPNPLRALADFGVQYCGRYGAAAAAAPTQRLLGLPVLGTRAAVVSSAVAPALSGNWKQMVVEPFQRTLAGKYPFAGGGPDASLADFTAAFGPQGYIAGYYQQNLAAYLNEDGSPKAGDVPVSGAMREFIRRAYEIRQAFFSAGAEPSLPIVLSTTPPRIDGHVVNVHWVAFDCGGEHVTYTMGPPHDETVHWPGADPMAGAALRVNATTQPDPGNRKATPQAVPVDTRSGEGVWGFFRLLDQASSISDQGGQAQATWTLQAGATQLHVTWTLRGPSAHHPFKRGFLRVSPP